MKRKTLLVGLLAIVVVGITMQGGSYASFGPAANAVTQDEIEEAIARGVNWLVSQQEGDGKWGDWQQVGVTCFALVALEERAYELGYQSAFNPDYPYSDNIIRGWQYILSESHAHVQRLRAQLHNGKSDNPDTNGNGYGIYFDTQEHSQTYNTGICLMALAAGSAPDRPNDGGLDYNGDGKPDTFKEIAQEAVDWLAFAQGDSDRTEGGWDYDAQDNEVDHADNSNSGYAVLGLAYGKEFDCDVPDWVSTELDVWINHIQCGAAGDEHGGSGYGGPCDNVNELKTGNLLFEMTFVREDASSTQRFQKALDYIERHWRDQDIDPGWGYNEYPADYQAMYTLMKGLDYSGIDLIDTDGDGDRDNDWHKQESPASPPQDFATVLMGQQNADGSWPGDCNHGNSVLCTVWALLTLDRAAPRLEKVLLTEAEAHQVIRFNPSAALQKRIFADGFAPNSPEFDVQVYGVQYRAQRAEHLGTGEVRVYYVKIDDWKKVGFFKRP